MGMNAIETHDLCKSYGKKVALDHVSISLREGEILGLVGKNGAGKTTLIRVLTDVAHPSSGSFSLLGATSPKEKDAARRQVAAMIERPSLYPNLTARDNLKARAILMNYQGDLNKFCDEQLHFVGLDEVAHSSRRAKDFSLGMQQRLGIAIALTGNPKLLILDEPTNGLDPQGISEMRSLLLRLNRERGMTMLISSHILGELSKLATRYLVIDASKIVAEATAEEVENGSGKRLSLRTDDNAKAREIALSSGAEASEEGGLLTISGYEESGPLVTKIVQGGVAISHLKEEMGSLESYFFSHIDSDPAMRERGSEK